jgi:hypothetical protein
MEALWEELDQIVSLLLVDGIKQDVYIPVIVLNDIDKKVNCVIQNVIIVRLNVQCHQYNVKK